MRNIFIYLHPYSLFILPSLHPSVHLLIYLSVSSMVRKAWEAVITAYFCRITININVLEPLRSSIEKNFLYLSISLIFCLFFNHRTLLWAHILTATQFWKRARDCKTIPLLRSHTHIVRGQLFPLKATLVILKHWSETSSTLGICLADVYR